MQCSPDTDEVSRLDITLYAIGDGDDPPDTFVAPNVRELDVGDVLAVCAGGGAVFGVKVCKENGVSIAVLCCSERLPSPW